ncbi:radical SAM protein [Candidatus Woesearchaeota archaeon CG10_big_fil_rev_8_21_14_0_10_32_9]|nr:MAG: radical SAM protein [Candidatus Woesearchaeota archaeon CG10_big_fil_rev_8_21_14_0_10_32_9]
MPLIGKNSVESVELSQEQEQLISEAKKIYNLNFNGDVWLGRCIFLSWYCALGNCDFCFRSTQKHKIHFPETARRTKESIYAEAFIAKTLKWKLEFLTGGYGIYSFKDLVEITKTCREILNEKIWLNLGVLSEPQLKEFLPYIEGVVASVETLEPILHKKVAPGKPLLPFEKMLDQAKALGLKRSMTIVLGLGETIDDYKYVNEWIKKHELSRITYYALRPVKDTPYEHGPAPEYVIEWIAKTRIDFPKIEIIIGSAETRIPEINFLLSAGANAFTKIPATKIFGTEGAQQIHEQVKLAGRKFTSELVKLPKVNWAQEVSSIITDENLKNKIILKLEDYQKNRLLKAYKDFKKVDSSNSADSCDSCDD